MTRMAILTILILLLAAPSGSADGPSAPAEPPPDAAGAPEGFEAVLCQGWDSASRPEGITDRFFSDNATVRVIFTTPEAPGAGHRIFPFVKTREGRLVVRGNPLTTEAGSNRWGVGFYLAGRDWARNGGEFVLELYWGDAKKEPAASLPFTISRGKRHALLVGIADYPPAGPGGPDLPNTDTDAKRMRDLLVGSFGFDRGNIELVTNLAATSARIARELEEMATRAGPEDAVLFYYVGHGAQIPDLDGDEADGWDEALATADVKPPLVTTKEQLELYISDDRLAELLDGFQTKNVTVIFDSCHSGTAVREGEDIPEGEGFPVRMQTRPGFGRKLVQMAEDAPRGGPSLADDRLDLGQDYVFIAAARSWETAVGLPAGGLFSDRLREALRTSNGESWDDLLHRIRPAVHRVNPGQTPSASGASRRFPFSLAEADRDAPYVRPTVAVVGAFDPENPSLLGEGRVGEHMAYISGLSSLIGEQAGVEYDVYAEADASLSGPPMGVVVITGKIAKAPRAGAAPLLYASADIVSGAVSRGDRLVPRAVRVPAARPSVGVFSLKNQGDAKESLEAAKKALIATLAKQPEIVLKSRVAPKDVDYIVIPQVQAGKVVASVYTTSFTFLGNFKGTHAEMTSQVRDLVTARHQSFARISRIGNPSPAFRLRFALEGGEGRRKAGSPIRLHGSVGRPAHITVLAVLENGGSEVVARSDGAVKAGEPIELEFPTRAGQQGRMALKVLATVKPLNQGGRLLGALRALFPPPGGEADLLSTEGWAEETIWITFE